MVESFFDSLSVLAKQANTDNTSVYINNVDVLISRTVDKIQKTNEKNIEERG